MTAARLDQSAIWYSACNEDTASEIAALQPTGKRILCITASGSRAFDLLLADPAEVVAVDQNPAQGALAELFAAAYVHCDYQAFCGLAGLCEDPERGATLDRLLPHLPPDAHAFWTRNRNLASNGLLYCGRWEAFLRRFRHWAGRRRQRLADRLLACPDRDTQWALWHSKWDDWQWRLFLRVLACRPLWRWGLREPGIAFVPRDFDMAGYARARFDHAARHMHLARLPFAWLMLNGVYHQDVLPPYLTEQGHGVIRDRMGRLKLVTASLQESLAAADPAAFDGASLSDYSSYCDLAEQRRLWQALGRAMTPGGRVCERKFFNKTGMDVPGASGFSRDDMLEQQLDARDGAWFYTFVVATRENACDAAMA
jgi:S-adenosylmethionine-diacylglycerol 3-amino-3-carboxypropyl transferase